MIFTRIRIIQLLTALMVLACGSLFIAPAARADSGSVWTRGQNGQLLNRVGTWTRENGRARIVILGSTQFLDVDMTQTLSSGGEDVFRYVATDTFAQPSNQRIWRAVGRGEVALDPRTMTSSGADGWWRRTETIVDTRNSLRLDRSELPRQLIRFVVESP